MPTLSIAIVADQAGTVGALAGFRTQVAMARSFPGCLSCYVEQDVEHPGIIRFHALWEAKAQLHGFLQSRIMDDLLQLVELSVEQPLILINGELGLDYLKEACRGSNRFAQVAQLLEQQ